MAQIQCPDCKKEISNKAEACPHCGYPLKNEREAQALLASLERDRQAKKRKRLIILGVVLALIVIGWLRGTSKPKEQAVQTPPAAVESKDPCANIKTMEDWEKASTLWRNTHSECKPK